MTSPHRPTPEPPEPPRKPDLLVVPVWPHGQLTALGSLMAIAWIAVGIGVLMLFAASNTADRVFRRFSDENAYGATANALERIAAATWIVRPAEIVMTACWC